MPNHLLVAMTALVPTTGHVDLINFASQLPDAQVHVLVNGRSFEPVPLEWRVQALQHEFMGKANVEIRGSLNDRAPQNPKDHLYFWQWWARETNHSFPEVCGRWSGVVASELYGKEWARVLGTDFYPYDIERRFNPARGADVRADYCAHWLEIVPQFRQRMALRAVLTGQESVGKTTLASKLAEDFSISFAEEWARPYLEKVDDCRVVTPHAMGIIHGGQKATQEAVSRNAKHPLLLFDTDLFSTIGYWQIMKQDVPEALEQDAIDLAGDVYYLFPDDVPLIPDPIRYGGAVRESSHQMWVNLLEHYSLPYVEVPLGSVDSKFDFLREDLQHRLDQKWSRIRSFNRD